MSSKLSFNKKNSKKTLLLSLVMVVMMGIGQLYAKNQRYEIPTKTASASSSSEIPYTKEPEAVKKIYVHIIGEVNQPSVVELDKGSRLFEAVDAAGGFTEQADQERINLAQEVIDGSQYIIPKQGDELIIQKNDGSKALGIASENDGKIDINRASKEELKTLDGIGDVLAERIIAARESRGGFTNLSQLLEVEGIGESKFHAIKDKVFCS